VTLRTRVTLVAGMAVLLVVLGLHVAIYAVVRANVRDQVDASLRHSAPDEHRVAAEEMLTSTAPEHVPLVHEAYMQVVDRNGEILGAFDDRPLPVTEAVLDVARGNREEAFFDTDVDGASVRVYVTSAGEGSALQLGRSLAEVENGLHRLFLTLTIVSVVAVSVAALIGRLVAAAATRPVRRVAEAAESVARTGELSHHIEVLGGDDLGRLATSFNTMLDALSESLAQQRQLVADASHELRTPLATVRTNVEVLTRVEELTADDRAMLIRDTVGQIAELTRLVEDLVELARGDGQEAPFMVVDLDDLTRHVVGVARRNHPSITFRVDGVPSMIRGAPERVSRAVSNLVDNAAKWSPLGADVEITVGDGAVAVRDHGPGIDPVDLPHVFDRFYRSPRARAMPGSGLGLAIVKQVADSHGGTVTAEVAPGGGSRFVLRLPTIGPREVAGAGEVRPRISSTSRGRL
jgi:two-component system sensor histidine kinase MprB